MVIRTPGTGEHVPHANWSRAVLLGFMASGKTEVGRVLAERLEWRFVDLDQAIERSCGMTIAEIFATRGEEAFRALEVDHTLPAIAGERVVLSPGGGWITNAGLFESLPSDTLTVWLKVSPEAVLERLHQSGNQPVRPLLQSPSPESRVRDLLAKREPLYRRAALWVDTDGRRIDEVVDRVEAIIRGARVPSQNQT